MDRDTAGPGNANRWIAALFGLIWLASGAVALTTSRHVGFFDPKGARLLGQFDLNGFRGAVMLGTGALLTTAAISRRLARGANLTAGLTWLALDLFALLAGHRSINVLALHNHDADLLLLAALALLTAGLALDLPPTTGTGPKYRTVRYGQGPRYIEAGDLPVGKARAGKPL